MLPPMVHSTLKKVIEVMIEEKNASERSIGASVATRMSTTMRYSGFSEPLTM